MSPTRASNIRSGYLNTPNPKNGDIFRRHIDAEQRGDQRSANEWLAMFSDRMRKTIGEFKSVDDGKLLEAFKKLLPFGALFHDFKVGFVNRVLSMRCREEIYCYLERMRRMWASILGSDVDLHCLDVKTVRLLEHLMPAYSSHDFEVIRTAMGNYDAFPRVHDDEIRRKLETRVVSCTRILTLETFRSDIMYLQVCFEPMDELFSTKGTTVQNASKWAFRQELQYFRASYIDVWLKIMGNYLDLSDKPSATVMKDRGQRTPAPHLKSQVKCREVACFAASRGFHTAQIDAHFTQSTIDARPEITGMDSPELSRDDVDLPLCERSNRPRQSSFERYRNDLTLMNIFHLPKKQCKRYPTSFAVMRDFVHCFWGDSPPTQQLSAYNLSASSVPAPLRMEAIASRTSRSPVRPASSDYDGSHCPPSSLSSAGRCPSGHMDWDETDLLSSYTPPFVEDCSESQPVHERAFLQDSMPDYSAQSSLSDFDRRLAYSTAQNTTCLMVSGDPQASQYRKLQSEYDQAALTVGEAAQQSVRGDSKGRVGHPAEQQQESRLRSERSRQSTQRREETTGRPPRPSKIVKLSRRDKGRIARQKRKLLDRMIRKAKEAPQGKGLSGQSNTETIITENVQLIDENVAPRREETSNAKIGDPHISNDGPRSVSNDNRNTMFPGAAFDSESRDGRPQAHRSPQERGVSTTLGPQDGEWDPDELQQQMQEVEEHILSAEEVVDEVYGGTVEEIGTPDTDKEHSPARDLGDSAWKALRPDESTRRATKTSEDRHSSPRVPGQTRRDRTSETVIGTSELGHLQPKPPGTATVPRNEAAILSHDHDTTQLHNGEEARGLILRSSISPQASRRNTKFPGSSSHLGKRRAESPILNPEPGHDRRRTVFPGSSAGDLLDRRPPGRVDQARDGGITTVPVSSKRRGFSDEGEVTSVRPRSTAKPTPVQITGFESSKEQIDFVRSIWDDLDHSRTYVTSTVDIEELASKQHRPHERLWSWAQDEEEQFRSQMESLLKKKYCFQIVALDQQVLPRHYRSMSHLDFWTKRFKNHDSHDWLAVLSQSPPDESWRKVRKTDGGS